VRFWDSSALVPLIVEEGTSDELMALYPEDQVAVWWGTEVECASAVARLEREGALDVQAATAALRELARLARGWLLVEPSSAMKESATRLLRTHDLRAADSLQLAAALVAAEHRPASLEFICRDRRLLVAAEREGLVVL